jgi:hypothetical protein
VEYLKDIDFLRQEFQHLSPTKGYIWSESGALENFAEIPLEPELLELQKFIRLFFYRLNANEFLVSTRETLISPYLTPYVIGKLIGEACKETPKEVIFSSIKGSKLRDGRLLIESKWTRREIGRQTRLVEDLLFKNKKDDKFYAVLLSLLWEKAVSKKDILDYYKGLEEHLGDSIFNEKGLAVIQNVSIPEEAGGGGSKVDSEDTGAQKAWLSSKFIPSDVETKPDISDLEGSLYWVFLNARGKNDIPLETQGYPKPYLPTNEMSFPDCGEVFLKNFFKLILDKNKRVVEGSPEGDYDTRILDLLDVHPDVKEFFKEFNTRELQKTQEARNAWGRITCRRDGVKYCKEEKGNGIGKKICEIDEGRSNMLALLNRLLQSPSTLESESLGVMDFTWEDFFQRIKEVRETVWGEEEGAFSVSEWEGREYGVEEFGEYRLITPHFSKCLWDFQIGHFHMEVLPNNKLIDFNDWESKNALDIYALYPTNLDKIKKLLQQPGESYAKFFLKLSGDILPQFFREINSSRISYKGVSNEEVFRLSEIFKTLKQRASNNKDLERRIKKAFFSGFVLSDELLNYKYLKNILYKDETLRELAGTFFSAAHHRRSELFSNLLIEIIEKQDIDLLHLVFSRENLIRLSIHDFCILVSAIGVGNIELIKFIFNKIRGSLGLSLEDMKEVDEAVEFLKNPIEIFEVLLEKMKVTANYNKFSHIFQNIMSGSFPHQLDFLVFMIGKCNINFGSSCQRLLSTLFYQASKNNKIDVRKMLLKKNSFWVVADNGLFFKMLLSLSLMEDKEEWVELLLQNNEAIQNINLIKIAIENYSYAPKFMEIIATNIEMFVNRFLEVARGDRYKMTHEKLVNLFSIFKSLKERHHDAEETWEVTMWNRVISLSKNKFLNYAYFKEKLYQDESLHELAQILFRRGAGVLPVVFNELLNEMIDKEDFDLLRLVFPEMANDRFFIALDFAFENNKFKIAKFLLEEKKLQVSATQSEHLFSLATEQGKEEWIRLFNSYKSN